MRIKLREGVAPENVKIAGMIVRRSRSGKISVYPNPHYRPKRRSRPNPNCFATWAASHWARVDRAGAMAWDEYAAELRRRRGAKNAPGTGHRAFVQAMGAAYRESPDAEPSLVPPTLPERKHLASRKRGAPKPAVFQGEGI